MSILLTASFSYKTVIFSVLGGLAIFLFGITIMGEYLKKIAGTKLRIILEKITNKPIKGILTGLVLTALIQSSSATAAIVIGLVSAGLLSLPNAIGVVLGAKIGTTVTSVLISFNLGDFALPIIFVGTILMLYFKKKKLRNIGGAILGFGLLFLGLNLMGDSLGDIAKLPTFERFLQAAGNVPILGVFTGIIATTLIQSSSATIGILQKLYTTGAIPLVSAIAIVLGSNIGTTITAVISSINGNKNGKKVAFIYVLFNVLGVLLFLTVLTPYTNLIVYLSKLVGFNPETSMATIALSHILYNIISVLVFVWFIKQFVFIADKVIKTGEGQVVREVVLDKKLLKITPELALENAKEAIKEMGGLAVGMLDYTYQYAFNNNEKAMELGYQSEELINHLDADIHNYLVELGSNDLSAKQMQRVAKHIDTVTDLERIGDHLENLFEVFTARIEANVELVNSTRGEIEYLFNIVTSQLTNVLEAYFTNNLVLAKKVEKQEFELNRLVKHYRNNYVIRISDNKECSNDSHYVDIISNLERIGDHCYNITENVLYEKYIYRKKEVTS